METTTIYRGIWKNEMHKLALRRFNAEHFWSRLSGFLIWIVFYWGLIAITHGVVSVSEGFRSPIFWICSVSIWIVLLCLELFIFLYRKRFLDAKRGDAYTVEVEYDGYRYTLVLRSGSAQRRVSIRRVFITSGFLYVGAGAFDYVVLPPDRGACDFLFDKCRDLLMVEFRGCFGFYGGRSNR